MVILNNLNVKAETSEIITIPFKKVKYKDDAEYWVKISVHEATDKFWAHKGFEIAKDQILLKAKTFSNTYSSTSKLAITTKETNTEIIITGKQFTAKVSKTNGELTSLIKNNKEQIASPLKPNFFRPPIDNDLRGASSRLFRKSREFWENFVSGLQTTSVKSNSNKNNETVVKVERLFKDSIKLFINYTFLSDGRVVVKMDMEADKSLPSLIRYGMTMGVPNIYTNTQFYGKGPWENYIDRKRGTEVDEFSFKTDELFYNYIFPQENANRSDVRWLKLTATKKEKLTIEGSPKFGFSIWAYSAENITQAKHPHDLKKQGFYTLNLDLVQMSVGGTLSETLPQFIIPSGKYSFEFVIK